VIGRLTYPAATSALCLALLGACASAGSNEAVPPAETPALAPRVSPVTDLPWVMATASVSDISRSARFFREIGGYETVETGVLDPAEIAALGLPREATGEALVLRAPGFDNAGEKQPMRPGSRAWDTGCFWSLMVRVRDMDSVYSDAIELGWWTHTPITDLQFGDSVLKVVVFQGPDGLQVQGYERISPPLEGFTPFERISQPFNIMQMTADRETARHLMEDVLGFGRFWFGAPYVDTEPTFMPLGIPRNLTTEVPYKAGIFFPAPGEYGRMEYIEIDGLEGHDFADRCHAPNLGWLSVSFEVKVAADARDDIASRDWPIAVEPYTEVRSGIGAVKAFSIRAPDGAMIEFLQRK